MAAVASFTFVKGQFDAFVSGAAGLKDMSERTGETVEKLSGLVAVARSAAILSKASKLPCSSSRRAWQERTKDQGRRSRA